MIWRFWRSKFDTLLAVLSAVWRVKSTLGACGRPLVVDPGAGDVGIVKNA